MSGTRVGPESWKRPRSRSSVVTPGYIPLEIPSKKQKIFNESDSEDGSLHEEPLKINSEYARRFEHNKKRVELHRLEEKYGKSKLSIQEGKPSDEPESGPGEESSSDETEDDEGNLANEILDQEILATLKAIRSKDPRVYDKHAKFYSEVEPEAESTTFQHTEKAMTLKEYHRRNLLNGDDGGDGDDDTGPAQIPYAKQQEALKRNLIEEMHEAADGDGGDDEDFLKPVRMPSPSLRPTIPDAAVAERDPERFLTDFLASRAWIPTHDSRFAALESDDDEEYDRAEEFETKYNLRFEDPEEVNKTLRSYDRAAIAEKTVRREDESARKRARHKEREKRELEKSERKEERARLRKLKIDQVEEKVKMIREAAGLYGKDFKIEEWTDVLEADWDDRWDQEMSKRFGEAYYQSPEQELLDEEGLENGTTKSKKVKKPKWNDDIDITDLVPEFESCEVINPALHLSEAEEDLDEGGDDGSKGTARPTKSDAKTAQRRDRRIISALIDQNLPLEIDQPGAKINKTFAPFRYRETSPGSFGLTPLDILAATDAQLNQYAGLKKLAAFRDPERKKKDKKKLSKKARLREWRKEAFGHEDGPERQSLFAPIGDIHVDTGPVAEAVTSKVAIEDGVNLREGSRKKKKRRRGKRSKDTSVLA